ncbi:hypothetical protein PUN28_016125 [Cardiocondyla obscurior]|uniref:Uncharacterized protein n=1 Tax=Cardiocondyla obscurior TaxID=286306 RepID=A0AAW2EX05_9HYME
MQLLCMRTMSHSRNEKFTDNRGRREEGGRKKKENYVSVQRGESRNDCSRAFRRRELIDGPHAGVGLLQRTGDTMTRACDRQRCAIIPEAVMK